MRPINYTMVDNRIETYLSSRHSDEIKTWARTVLKNALYNQARVVKLVVNKYRRVKDGRILGTRKNLNVNKLSYIAPVAVYIKSAGWCSIESDLQKEMLIKDKVVSYCLRTAVSHAMSVLDWLAASPEKLPKDMTRLSYDVAKTRSDLWHETNYARLAFTSARRAGKNSLTGRFPQMLLDSEFGYMQGMRIIESLPPLTRDRLSSFALIDYQVGALRRMAQSYNINIPLGRNLPSVKVEENCVAYATFFDGRIVGKRLQLAPDVWVLLDQTALTFEGSAMCHCVGSYGRSIANGTTLIFHIDSVCATIEITDKTIKQIKGRFNCDVVVPKDLLDICQDYADSNTKSITLSHYEIDRSEVWWSPPAGINRGVIDPRRTLTMTASI